jgi:hypothetical protein
MSTADERLDLPWQRLQTGALAAGVLGLLLCAVGYFVADPRKVFFSYLYAYNFVLGLALGSLGIWMLHNLTGGAWGAVIRRPLEAASRTLPLLAVLFIPVAVGIRHLYLWADPHQLGLDPNSVLYKRLEALLDHKAPYLNVPFFLIRAVLYFAVWIGISLLLNRWAEEVDRTNDPAVARRAQVFSSRALVFFGGAVTFAAFDWLMSLEPTWYSTIFGVLVAVGQLLPAMAFAVGLAALLAPRTTWGRAVTPEVWNDLGNLMLAMILLWAYMSFSQLLLIWSGNLPEEISWYVIRSTGGWQYVGGALALFYFAVPFLLLLSRTVKRHLPSLTAVAGLLLVMSVVQQFFLVNPVYCNPMYAGERAAPAQEAEATTLAAVETPLCLHWLDAAALVGLVGVWLAFFLWQLQRRPLTPPPDPLVQEEPHYA